MESRRDTSVAVFHSAKSNRVRLGKKIASPRPKESCMLDDQTIRKIYFAVFLVAVVAGFF